MNDTQNPAITGGVFSYFMILVVNIVVSDREQICFLWFGR